MGSWALRDCKGKGRGDRCDGETGCGRMGCGVEKGDEVDRVGQGAGTWE